MSNAPKDLAKYHANPKERFQSRALTSFIDLPNGGSTPSHGGRYMAELGVFIGNEPSALAHFESWLGRPVDAVLGYTNGSSWSAADPSWQISSGGLGGTGREILWSI